MSFAPTDLVAGGGLVALAVTSLLDDAGVVTIHPAVVPVALVVAVALAVSARSIRTVLAPPPDEAADQSSSSTSSSDSVDRTSTSALG